DATAQDVGVGTDGTLWALDTAGSAYTGGSAHTGGAASTIAPVVLSSPAVGADGTGRLHQFGVAANGSVWTSRLRAGQWWSGLVSLGRPAGDPARSVATAADAAGRLHAFAVTGGGVARLAQTAPGAGWGRWARIGAPAGTSLTELAAEANADGRLQVFAAGADHRLHTAWETAPGEWSAWGELSPADPAVAAVHATRDRAGLLHVFVLDTDGGVHAIVSTAADGGWGSWTALGWPAPTTVGALTVAANADGRLQLFAVGADHVLHTLYQRSDGAWSAWAPLVSTPVLVTSVSAVLAGSGRLTVAGLGTDGAVQVIAQSTPDGGWGPWSAIGAPAGGAPGGPVLGIGPGGPTLLAPASPVPWATTLAATGWDAWQPLPGPAPMSWRPLPAPIPLAQAPAGSAGNLWTVGTDGTPRHADASDTWIALPLPGGAGAASVSVTADGSVWAAGVAGACYRWAGQWQQVSAVDLARAPVGDARMLWAPGRSGELRRSADGGHTWWVDTGHPGCVVGLAAAADGTVWAVDTGGGAAVEVPWRRSIRPTGMPGWASATGTAVATGTDPTGLRYAVLTGPAGTSYSIEPYRHAWTEPAPLTEPLTDLRITRHRDSGQLIVHGVDDNSSVVAVGGPDVAYQVTRATPFFDNRFLPGLEQVVLVASDAGGWTWFAVAPDGGPAGGQLLTAAGAPGQTYLVFTPVENGAGPADLTSLVALPWAQDPAAPGVLALDAGGGVHLVTPSTSLTLTGGTTSLQTPVAAVAAVLQADTGAPAQPRIYAVAPAGTSAGARPDALWVLRLVDPTLPPTDAAAWSSWIPIGGGFQAPAGGPALLATDTLFAAGTDGSLVALTQDPATGRWTDLPVHRPSVAGAELLTLPTYQTTVTVLAAGGRPEAGVPVTITPAEPVELWIGGTVARVDPGQPVGARSDGTGRVRLRTLATGLHTAELSLQVPGQAGATTVYPPQHVHDFLAGSGTLAVGGGQPVPLTAHNLQTATNDDGTLLAPNLPEATAKNVVQASAQIAAMPGAAMPAALSAPGSWDGFWHGVKHVADDVASGVKHGVVAVEGAAVDAERGVVTLTLKVAGEIVSTVELVVNDVASAMRAIEIVWAGLVADLEKIIEWLRLLLEWGDIMHTQKVLAELVGQALGVAQTSLALAEQQVQGFFTALESTVDQYFDEALAAFPYASFADLPDSTPTAAAVAVPQPPPVQLEWLFNEVIDHLVPGLDLGTCGVSTAEVLAVIDPAALLAPITTAVSDFITYIENVVRDPGNFAQLSVAELVEQTKDLVHGLLRLLDDFVQGLLQLLGEALPGIVGLLGHHLDIPLVSDLYRLVTGEDMTTLGAATLLMAVPVTIVYKMINDGERPFDGVDLGAAAGAGLPISPLQWAEINLGLGVLATLIAGASDGMLVAETPEGSRFAHALNVLGPVGDLGTLAQQVASWPSSIGGFPNVDLGGLPADQAWALGNWAAWWLPPLVDLILVGLSELPPEVPLLAATLTGVPCLVTGIGAAATGAKASPPVPGEAIA
ncbi:MAG: hypothetical protein L0H84_11070, partial [Pseudonocardia sp.]|nr:hypothetical protein [Pseudonocardia sp.]